MLAQTSEVQLNTVAIATLVSLFIPALVSLVTKRSASSGVKAIVNIIAVGLTSIIALWMIPGASSISLALIVNTFILSLVTSVTAYKGFWKPTGLTESIAAKTPDIGIGSPENNTDKGGEI